MAVVKRACDCADRNRVAIDDADITHACARHRHGGVAVIGFAACEGARQTQQLGRDAQQPRVAVGHRITGLQNAAAGCDGIRASADRGGCVVTGRLIYGLDQ